MAVHCRNRVAVQLQKNLDRQRLKRVAHKLSSSSPLEETPQPPRESANGNDASAATSGSRTGGYFGGNPGELAGIARQKTPADDDDEYEYYEEEDEEGGDK